MWKRIMLATIACSHSTYVKIWPGLKSFYFRRQLIIDFIIFFLILFVIEVYAS